MRTTLDIADDVLFAAKEMARHQKKPVGQVISELARRAFTQAAAQSSGVGLHSTEAASPPHQVSERLALYGIRPLPARGGVVSNEMINRLRDVEGI